MLNAFLNIKSRLTGNTDFTIVINIALPRGKSKTDAT